MESEGITLLHIPWEDIIFARIFKYLKLRDIIMLRILSTHYKALITEYLRVVVQLDFHGSQISNSSFYSLTEACKNLKALSVWDCRKLEDKSIVQILQNNSDLELLDIGKCPLLSSDILQSFKLCKNLKKLSLHHSQWLNNKGLHLIIEYLVELECLDISKCFKISEEAILTLINSYQGIRELNLSYIECVDDQILIMLAEHCKSLECLSLNNCWRITERGILKVLEYCPLLRSLESNNCPMISHQFHSRIGRKGIETNNDVEHFHYFPVYLQI